MKTMGFTDAIKAVFSKYATFEGRARRSEYWYWALFCFIIGLLIGWIPVIGWLVSLALLVPGIAVAVRRLHDMGKSGWFYLLILIPLIGSIILIVMFCQDSQPGENEWGANPKE